MASPIPLFLRPRLLGALLLLLGALPASAQWVVYDMRMLAEEASSVNFVHYSGAYLIAPMKGGPASLVFTTEENGGHYFALAQNGARYFVAANAAKRRAVISASANVGTSQSLYQASGALDTQVTYFDANRQAHTDVVAFTLTGHLMTSDDEHLATAPAADGSLGVVGEAVFKGFYRKDLADKLNAEAGTMPQAITVIAGLLQKYGYQPEQDADQISVPAQPNDPLPIPPSPDAVDGSLFPAGSREDMERALQTAR